MDQATSAAQLDSKVLEWIETSGRALELRTARTFSHLDSARLIRQSMTYEDVTSKVQREGDVHAIFHSLTTTESVSIEVAVECKSSKHQPWVAFYDDKVYTPTHPDLWFVPSGTTSDDLTEKFVQEWLQTETLLTDRVATHVVSALGAENKKTSRMTRCSRL